MSLPPEDVVKRIEQAIRDQDPVALRAAAGELRTWLDENPDEKRSPAFVQCIETLAQVEVPPDFRPGSPRAELVFADPAKGPTMPAPRPGWPFKPAEKPSGTIPYRR